MTFRIIALSALFLMTAPRTVLAYESEDQPYGYLDAPIIQPRSTVKAPQLDQTRIEKFEAALDVLGIPKESAPDFSNFVQSNEVNEQELRRNLRAIDPDQGLFRYVSIQQGWLELFRDFFSKTIPASYLEFSRSLSTKNPSVDSDGLMQRLRLIASQVRTGDAKPLNGLKVLIDPGHMGGDLWDQRTGKFVSVNGRKVSEGDLTLWTSLVTAKKLVALGATVILTRDREGTVSTNSLENFDATPFVHSYFYNSLDDWMAPYLEKPIDELKRIIRTAPETQKAFSEKQRAHFYIFGEDLEARARLMDHYQPDITLVVHYDASKNDQLQNSVQSLEAFIPGAFRATETGSRKSKALALKHLLEVRRWNQTVELADQVTGAMSKSLAIPRLNKPEAFNGIRVKDGVYTRNLFLTRRLLTGLMVYLECLHYDHVNEHTRLSIRDKTLKYNSETIAYPSRIDDVANGIENGILSYFKSFNVNGL
jgi:N-acetylmuramoyl-L-alanine amidase